MNRLRNITLNTARKWLLVLMLVQISIHVPYLNRPAMGNHVWRQCNTLAIARNYAEEDMRIWLPRIDKRYHFSGVTGPSFPAYEYALAVLYKTFGFSEFTHRFLSLFLSLLALLGLYNLVFAISGSPKTALFASYALMAIPEFYYHSINAVPDLLALTAMLWGWYSFKRWWTIGALFWLPATLLLMLAGLVKLQFLICGVPIALLMFNSAGIRDKSRWSLALIMAALVSLAAYGWYRYAHFLTFQNWLNEFVLDIRLPSGVGDFLKIFSVNLISDFPETWLGYALIPGFIAGIYTLIGYYRHRWLTSVVFTTLGAFAVYLLLQRQFIHHGYYTLFLSPFFAMAAGFGYATLSDVKRFRWMQAFLWLAPVWAWLRMSHNWNWENSRIPNELVWQKSKVIGLTDTSKRYIVGPDQSGVIYFYYLNAKGFPWYNLSERQDVLCNWVRLGATGLITDKPGTLMMNYSDSLNFEQTGAVGGFYWYNVTLRNQK